MTSTAPATRSAGSRFGWYALGLLIAVAALLVAWVAPFLVRSFYLQMIEGRTLEQELGFRHGSPYIHCGDSFDEVLTIERVTRGGVCDAAGFREGDVVRGLSITELFELLHESRGGAATVVVVDGGNGPALDERTERRVTVGVPAAR